jgi:hypothetical protein
MSQTSASKVSCEWRFVSTPTHVGLTLIGTILFALSVIFRVWG